MQRPTGVTILAILAVIGGILGILGSLALIGIGGAAAGIGAAANQGAAGLGGAVVVLIGLGSLLSAVLSLVFGIGAWGLRPWAWTLGVFAEALSLVLSLLGLLGRSGNAGGRLLSAVIAAGILYYLFRPAVRHAFRQG